MEQPEGMEEQGKESYMVKLDKGLYGLNQANKGWNKRLNVEMLKKKLISVVIIHFCISNLSGILSNLCDCIVSLTSA